MPSSTERAAAEALAALRAMDRDGTLPGRLREAFERTLARQRPRLDAARQRPPDRAALAEALHVLRSAALQLGGSGLLDSCHALEHCPDAELPARLDEFDTQLAAFRANLAAWA